MGDGRRDGASDGESWTEMESVQPDMIEAVPVRHGMVLGGRYVIEKIIGRGGAGVVVRAHDRDLQAVVAIKIVRAELVGQRMWAERLAREVKLARQIQHPHVCRVFDFEQADGRAFLVMELAERGSLRDEIHRGETRARPWAARIADARAVASALDAIHGAGIVHRDLTPQNLLRLADGRLVVSDFGLATDAGESTSVHGGTFAYMAPEVVRGGKSTRASDVWALGVVMYEAVFGDRPRWRDAASSDMLPPDLGRKLTRDERRVFETCRACTAKEPGWRVGSAAEAGRALTDGPRWWASRALRARRPAVWAGALVLAAAVVVGVSRRERSAQEVRPPGTESTPQSPLIVPTGEPADWTDVASVIAEVPERIHCTRLLQDKRTIRFVWGSPPRAEDIDVVNRKRTPSPLVPAAYAEGCPDLSPDGKRLVYQGHSKDGRAFAFLSEHPDGKDAVPVAATAEPTMSSEPTWLADGQTFSYDVDLQHMGVFATASRHMYVLPQEGSQPYVTSFRSVVGNVVFVSAVLATGQTQITGVQLPWLERADTGIRISELALDLKSVDGVLYYVSGGASPQLGLVHVDPAHRTARRIGGIPDQILRYPIFLEHGLVFVSIRRVACLAERRSDGTATCLPHGMGIHSAAHCGQDLVVEREVGVTAFVVERVDKTGKMLKTLTSGRTAGSPSCLPGGDVWFFADWQAKPRIMRCDSGGCRMLVESSSHGLSVSPDGTRLALTTMDGPRPTVGWMNVEGGAVHTIAETETNCAAGWATNRTLWVSRRRDGRVIWTEVDADSGKDTGRTVPGMRDCSTGDRDPASPVNPDLPILLARRSQLRLLGNEYLGRRTRRMERGEETR